MASQQQQRYSRHQSTTSSFLLCCLFFFVLPFLFSGNHHCCNSQITPSSPFLFFPPVMVAEASSLISDDFGDLESIIIEIRENQTTGVNGIAVVESPNFGRILFLTYQSQIVQLFVQNNTFRRVLGDPDRTGCSPAALPANLTANMTNYTAPPLVPVLAPTEIKISPSTIEVINDHTVLFSDLMPGSRILQMSTAHGLVPFYSNTMRILQPVGALSCNYEQEMNPLQNSDSPQYAIAPPTFTMYLAGREELYFTQPYCIGLLKGGRVTTFFANCTNPGWIDDTFNTANGLIPHTNATTSSPSQMIAIGDQMYVAERRMRIVRRIHLNASLSTGDGGGAITVMGNTSFSWPPPSCTETVPCTLLSTVFLGPRALAAVIDPSNNHTLLFVGDASTGVIFRADLQADEVVVIAGQMLHPGYKDGAANVSELGGIRQLTATDDTLYIADGRLRDIPFEKTMIVPTELQTNKIGCSVFTHCSGRADEVYGLPAGGTCTCVCKNGWTTADCSERQPWNPETASESISVSPSMTLSHPTSTISHSQNTKSASGETVSQSAGSKTHSERTKTSSFASWTQSQGSKTNTWSPSTSNTCSNEASKSRSLSNPTPTYSNVSLTKSPTNTLPTTSVTKQLPPKVKTNTTVPTKSESSSVSHSLGTPTLSKTAANTQSSTKSKASTSSRSLSLQPTASHTTSDTSTRTAAGVPTASITPSATRNMSHSLSLSMEQTRSKVHTGTSLVSRTKTLPVLSATTTPTLLLPPPPPQCEKSSLQPATQLLEGEASPTEAELEGNGFNVTLRVDSVTEPTGNSLFFDVALQAAKEGNNKEMSLNYEGAQLIVTIHSGAVLRRGPSDDRDECFVNAPNGGELPVTVKLLSATEYIIILSTPIKDCGIYSEEKVEVVIATETALGDPCGASDGDIIIAKFDIKATPQAVLTQTNEANTATTIVSSAGSMLGGGAAVLDQQALAVAAMMFCGGTSEKKMLANYRLLAPLAIEQSWSGIVWGNLILVGAVLLLQMTVIGIAYLRNRAKYKKSLTESSDGGPKKQKKSLNAVVTQEEIDQDDPFGDTASSASSNSSPTLVDAMGTARFPSIQHKVIVITFQGTSFAALQLVSSPGRTIEDTTLGSFFAGACVIYFVFLVWFSRARIEGDFMRYQYELWKENPFPRWFVRGFLPSGVWAPATFRHRFAGWVTSIQRTERFWVTTPMWGATLMSIASLFRLPRSGCVILFASIAALQAVIGIMHLMFRPHRSFALNVLSGIGSLTVGLFLAFTATNTAEPSPEKVAVILGIAQFQMALTLLRVVATLISIALESIVLRKQGSKLSTELKFRWVPYSQGNNGVVEDPTDSDYFSEEQEMKDLADPLISPVAEKNDITDRLLSPSSLIDNASFGGHNNLSAVDSTIIAGYRQDSEDPPSSAVAGSANDDYADEYQQLVSNGSLIVPKQYLPELSNASFATGRASLTSPTAASGGVASNASSTPYQPPRPGSTSMSGGNIAAEDPFESVVSNASMHRNASSGTLGARSSAREPSVGVTNSSFVSRQDTNTNSEYTNNHSMAHFPSNMSFGSQPLSPLSPSAAVSANTPLHQQPPKRNTSIDILDDIL